MLSEIMVVALSFAFAATPTLGEELPLVDVVNVSLAPPTQILVLPGVARGWYHSNIYARVTGYVSEWFVDIGDRVKKGQVLATIDSPELDAQLAAAQAHLKASKDEAKVKEAEVEFAKATYQRWQGSPKGTVSAQGLEDKKSRYEVATERLRTAQAQINRDQDNVDRITVTTRFKQVIAPYDSVITDRRVDIGDLVIADMTRDTTPLFRIAQFEQIRVFVNVPEAVSAVLEVGTAAQITAGEFPNRSFEGKLARTSQSIDPRACALRVEVDLPNEGLVIKPGMNVYVKFNPAPIALVQVPASALLFRSSAPQVALIDRDNRVRFQNVSVARDDGDFVEIASGLSVGDKVAVDISSRIVDGDTVTVRQSDEMAAKSAVLNLPHSQSRDGSQQRMRTSDIAQSGQTTEVREADERWSASQCASR